MAVDQGFRADPTSARWPWSVAKLKNVRAKSQVFEQRGNLKQNNAEFLLTAIKFSSNSQTAKQRGNRKRFEADDVLRPTRSICEGLTQETVSLIVPALNFVWYEDCGPPEHLDRCSVSMHRSIRPQTQYHSRDVCPLLHARPCKRDFFERITGGAPHRGVLEGTHSLNISGFLTGRSLAENVLACRTCIWFGDDTLGTFRKSKNNRLRRGCETRAARKPTPSFWENCGMFVDCRSHGVPML